MKENRKNKKERIPFNRYFPYRFSLLIQFICSAILVFFIIRLNILSNTYLFLIIDFLVVALVFNYLVQRQETKARSVVTKVMGILLSICCIVGSVYIEKGNDFLNRFGGHTTETRVMSVIVKNESEYQKIEDLKGRKIGSNPSVDTEFLNEAINDIATKVNTYQLKEYTDFPSLADSLYDGGSDAIVVEEAYRPQMEINHENFTYETKVLYTYEKQIKVQETSKPIKGITTKPFTVYISGIDTYGKVSTVSRTDVNIMVTVNPNTKQILLTSIPRDSYIPLASRGEEDKFTHSGTLGIKESINTLEQYFDVDIQYYVRLNFTSFIKVIDTLGGITVYSPYEFRDSNKKYKFVKGDNTMDGEMALTFVRERYRLPSGDYDRGKNQMRVVEAVIRKMMSPSLLKNFDEILNTIGDSVQTSMDTSTLKELIKFQLDKSPDWEIQTMQLRGVGDNTYSTNCSTMKGLRVWVSIPNQEDRAKISSLIQSMCNNEKISVS